MLPKEVFVQSWHHLNNIQSHPQPVDVATPEQADIRADLHLLAQSTQWALPAVSQKVHRFFKVDVSSVLPFRTPRF